MIVEASHPSLSLPLYPPHILDPNPSPFDVSSPLPFPINRSMPAVEEKLEDERVWALTEASFAQNSAKSLVDSCERSLKVRKREYEIL